MNVIRYIAVSFFLLLITLGVSLTSVLLDNRELKKDLQDLKAEVVALDLKCEKYKRICDQNMDIILNDTWEKDQCLR